MGYKERGGERGGKGVRADNEYVESSRFVVVGGGLVVLGICGGLKVLVVGCQFFLIFYSFLFPSFSPPLSSFSLLGAVGFLSLCADNLPPPPSASASDPPHTFPLYEEEGGKGGGKRGKRGRGRFIRINRYRVCWGRGRGRRGRRRREKRRRR